MPDYPIMHLGGISWAKWRGLFRIYRNMISCQWSNVFTRRVRWWIAATIILALLTISLSISIPAIPTADRKSVV